MCNTGCIPIESVLYATTGTMSAKGELVSGIEMVVFNIARGEHGGVDAQQTAGNA